MNKPISIRRLDREHYQADAIVHWSIATLDRRGGWRARLLLDARPHAYGLMRT